MSRRFVYLRLLRVTLVLAAIYDISFAVLMVTAPEIPAAFFVVPLPPDYFLHLTAVLLVMLGALYLAAAEDPRRYSAVIVIAIGGRTLGAILLALSAWGDPSLSGLWALAGIDLLFAVLHLVFWLPQRR